MWSDVLQNKKITINNTKMSEGIYKPKLGKMFIEVDGVLTDITALPKPQYERFLEIMNQLRLAYIAITTRI